VAAVPEEPTLDAVRKAAASCRRCDLWRHATQTVFGEGPSDARLMLVGEQPGDREDIAGKPFVGPAGSLLDRALTEAGIDRDDAYLTNAVKHFKWRPSAGGKKRLHDKPGWTEVRACLPWLEAELAAVRPEVLVPMGATATQALLGGEARVTTLRGQPLEHELAPLVVVTVHPSSVLRARDDASRRESFSALVADLEVAAAGLRGKH
jgi:uracil-DNA glycosylase